MRALLRYSLMTIAGLCWSIQTNAQSASRESGERTYFQGQFEALKFNNEKTIRLAVFVAAPDTIQLKKLKENFSDCPFLTDKQAIVYAILVPNDRQTAVLSKTISQILDSYSLRKADLLLVDYQQLSKDVLTAIAADGFREKILVAENPPAMGLCDFIQTSLTDIKTKLERELPERP
ncbi:MAG: hypothetical protein V4616_13545 [Bacteroidota bacterium]